MYIHNKHVCLYVYIYKHVHNDECMHVVYILVSNCYQIIKRVGRGIRTTDGAGCLVEGMCDLHCPMWIKILCGNKKLLESDHHTYILDAQPTKQQSPNSNQTPDTNQTPIN